MKKYVFHPFLFTLYSVLFLFAANVDRVSIQKTFPIILLLLFCSALILVLFRLITNSWAKAGLLSTLMILLFISFGSVYNLITTRQILGVLGQANVLAAIYAAIFILIGWWILRKLRNPDPINIFLNVVSIILICFPILNMGVYFISNPLVIAPPANPFTDGEKTDPDPSQIPPDIYYIVLDEYGRSDVLRDILSYDNSDFIQYLKEKGFYVADQSHSNYIISHLSMASSLNHEYLNDKMENSVRIKADDVSLVTSMIHSNISRALLKEAGYKFITFATGYSFTEIENSDEFLQPNRYINDFTRQYIDSTILALFSESIYGPNYRNLILNAFNGLSAIPEKEPDTPKFVFAHINAVHVPFVFGPNGEAIHSWIYTNPSNPSGTGTIPYSEAYKNQAVFINKQVKKTIDSILSKSKRKPVIIIQGDHGPESLLDWSSVERSCIRERTSILNAYYFPDGDYHRLYPSITPVNTFRVIFDTYLGANLGLLEDHTYFSIWNKPYDFIDVTDKANNPCKPAK
jgi:hypothetical protein